MALNIPTWKLASCLLRRLQLLGPMLGDEQGAEQVLEGDEDDAEEGDPGEADLDVEEGDPDRHQRSHSSEGSSGKEPS